MGENDPKYEREDDAPDDRDVPPEEELHDGEYQDEHGKMCQPTQNVSFHLRLRREPSLTAGHSPTEGRTDARGGVLMYDRGIHVS